MASTYVGGHTKIMLSEEGTVWPTHEDDFGKLKESKSAHKRWGDDVLADDEGEAATRSDWKRHVFRILAVYAQAYRSRAKPQPVERVPEKLIADIRQAGGVIDWIASDPARVKRFWEFVRKQIEQEARGARVAVIVRRRPQGGPSFKRPSRR